MSDSKQRKTSINLFSLPDECTIEILGHTKTKDICSVSLANRKFYRLLQDDYVWQLMCKNQYPASRILEAQRDLTEDEALRQLFITNVRSSTNVPPVTASAAATTTEHDELKWTYLYKYLSNPISYMAKERGVVWLDCYDGPRGYGSSNHWETEDGESEYGKIVHLNYVWWFNVTAKLKCVQPGTYDIIWGFRVHERHYGLGGLNFKTQVLSNSYEELDAPETTVQEENHVSILETIVQEENHVSRPELFRDILSKGTWTEYCLPYQVVVPEERVVDGEYTWYDVRCKIYNHVGHQKGGLYIDYVKLRHHLDGREYDVFEE